MTTNEPDNTAARNAEGADPEHSARDGAHSDRGPAEQAQPDLAQAAKGPDRAAASRAAGGIPTGAVSTRDLQDLARRRREAEEKLQHHLEEAKHKPAHRHDGDHHDGGDRHNGGSHSAEHHDGGRHEPGGPGGEPGHG